MNNILGSKSKHIKFETISSDENPLILDCGKKLKNIVLAYETFGILNEEKNNVILINHALTGDSHVGTHSDEPEIIGWWCNFIGPGLIFDTNKYYILCSNVLGGCMGSTGPSSINPNTNEPYRLTFPMITIKDMVMAQKRLIDKLKIPELLAVVGGSMGGMQTLEWAIDFPDIVKSCIPIATTSRLSPQGIAFNEVGRKAIVNDEKWQEGNYSTDNPPIRGLSLARMIGHITYLSDEGMHEKFGRDLRDHDDYEYDFRPEFEVETYLNYQGDKFTKRFDANTYLYLTKSIDYFDLEKIHGSLVNAFKKSRSKFLIITFKSDWLYPSYQGKKMVYALQQAGKHVTYSEIESNYGHDAFLLEYDNMAPILINFLNNVGKNPKFKDNPKVKDNFSEEENLVSNK